MRALTMFFLLVALMGSAFSQSASDAVRIVENEMGVGARAQAMGGAYTALADDYTAIYWNPAGLASIKSSQFFGEVSHLNYGNQALFQGQVTDESQNYTRLRSLGFAFPLPARRGSMVVALGYNRVKDFDQNLVFSGFNRNSNGLGFEFDGAEVLFDRDVYQSETVSDEGSLDQWSLGFGIALSPNFTAGVTLNIWSGQDDYQFTFFQEDRDNIYNQMPGDFRSYLLNQTLKTDYQAVGVKVGGMFHLAEGIRVGGAIGFPVTFNVNETFASNDLIVFDNDDEDAADLGAGEFEYDVKTPLHFDAGAAFSNDRITLSGSIRYRDWAQTRFDVPDNFLGDDDYVALFEENNVIRQNYRATLQYNIGGEILLPGVNGKLRAGYGYYPSPLDNVSSDQDKEYITGGMGFMVDRYVSLDITYIYGSWKQSSEDVYTPGGTLEDITVNKFLVGLTYRF